MKLGVWAGVECSYGREFALLFAMMLGGLSAATRLHVKAPTRAPADAMGRCTGGC